jgi:hypothetical protein
LKRVRYVNGFAMDSALFRQGYEARFEQDTQSQNPEDDNSPYMDRSAVFIAAGDIQTYIGHKY